MRLRNILIITIAFIIATILFVSCGNNHEEYSSNYYWQKHNDVGATSVYSHDIDYVLASFGNALLLFDGSSWKEQLRFEGVDIGDIFILGEEEVWLVGYKYENGTEQCGSAIYHYDGSSWEEDANIDGCLLDAITAVDSENIWAAGNNSQDLSPGVIYFNDGYSWGRQYELEEDIVISDITSADANHAWAAASHVDSGPGYVKPEGPGYIYFFDGSNWEKQYEIEDEEQGCVVELLGIYALDQTHVWAVGRKSKGGVYINIIHFYDGSSWNKQYEAEGDRGLARVCAVDKNHVWAVGGNEILFFNGSNWEKQYELDSVVSITDNTPFITDVSANNINKIWAASTSGIYLGEIRSD